MSTNGTTAVAAATGGKRPSTNIGEPLSEESLRLVREVRRQLTVPLHSNFDSDFNVYRFVANAERTQKARMNRKELVDAAARALNGHLRVRNCLRLDDLPDVPFEQNRLFREHFLPTSPILEGTDSQNRLLWFIEYRSLSVETIAHGIRSSESIRCQFWQFEHMLRKVNEQERRSGRLSSVRHVVDMAGYELNPFTFGFLSSGTLSYYSQLLHYDNYPELVYPIEMVNIAKWIHIPYRLIKAMMPAGFTDRFRLHDDNFLEAMSSEIPIEHIPRTLGGQNPTRCVPAQRMAASQYWQPSHPALLGQLETVQIGPRKHKLFRVQIQEQQQQQQKGQQQQLQQQVLSWYLRTDGDIFFGVFYEPPPPTKASPYLPYDPVHFSLGHFFRPQTDLVASMLVHSGMDGIDRYQISRRLGINANTKAGNRIVTGSIHAVLRAHPRLFGEYHKMEGRQRAKRYYVKTADNQPGGKTSQEYSARFKEITGQECPFRMGDALKFPGHNLNTLLISDVTLKRLVIILEHLREVEAIVTTQKLQNYITDVERQQGYKYTIDRKSLKKLLLALSNRRFLNMLSMEVLEKDQIHKVEVITMPAIKSLEHPRVSQALALVMDEFREQNKSFPTGHQLKRPKQEVEEEKQREEGNDDDGEEGDRGEGEQGEEGEKSSKTEPKEESGSLLDRTFTTLERLQFQRKYGSKPGGVSPFSVLSQKSLNSLVEAAKRRRNARSGPRKKRKAQQQTTTRKEGAGEGEEEEIEAETRDWNDEDEPTSSTAAANRSTGAGIGGSGKQRRKKRNYSHGRRLVDNVDRVSLQHKAYLRSRFTQRERDMLLLIRACSFFLNPVSRFWPHPKVMRNLMHEFVPESRTKTTYSLMAAGVRELKERQPQYQYVVKTLASYGELLTLRNRMARTSLSKQPLREDAALSQKDVFFVDAFRKTYQLLFRENDDFPSIQADDRAFRAYLRANNLHFLQVSDGKSGGDISSSTANDATSAAHHQLLMSQIPRDEASIRSAMAFNAIMSVLHYESGCGNKSSSSGDQKPKTLTADAVGFGTSIEAGDQPKATEEVEVFAEENATAAVPIASSPPADDDMANFLIEQIPIGTLAETMRKIRSDGFITKNRVFSGSAKEQREEEREAEAGATATMAPTTAPVEAAAEAGDEQVKQQQHKEWEEQIIQQQQQLMQRRKMRITQYYHHFFESSYHPNLALNICSVANKFMLAAGDGQNQQQQQQEHDLGQQEDPAEFIILADLLEQMTPIEMETPESLGELFVLKKSNATATAATAGAEDQEVLGPSTSSTKTITAAATSGGAGGIEEFLSITASATKQLRYLEDSELRLERLRIRPQSLGCSLRSLIAHLPEPNELIGPAAQLIPAHKMPTAAPAQPAEGRQDDIFNSNKSPPAEIDSSKVDSKPITTTSTNQNQTPPTTTTASPLPLPDFGEEEGDEELMPLFRLIDGAGLTGITEQELAGQLLKSAEDGSSTAAEQIELQLNKLHRAGDIFACGVDQRRWVATRRGRAWLLVNREGQGFVPKPWTLPTGETNWHVLSWMLEGFFSLVYASPGLTVDQLVAHFAPVLHRALILDLLAMLEKLGCCKVSAREVPALRKKSPFAAFNQHQTVRTVQPCTNGMEKIVLFRNVKIAQ